MVKTIYKCEECGKTFTKMNEAIECEKSHEIARMKEKSKITKMHDIVNQAIKFYEDFYLVNIDDKTNEEKIEDFFKDFIRELLDDMKMRNIIADYSNFSFTLKKSNIKEIRNYAPEKEEKDFLTKINKQGIFDPLAELLEI